MEAPPSAHPAEESLRSYGLGKLDGDAARDVEAHLETCPDCRGRLAGLGPDSFLGRLRESARPAGSDNSPLDGTISLAAATGPSPPPPPADSLPPGLADHADYQIRRELGRGGMGVVYLAHNTMMGRDEVLKVIGRQIMDRPSALERFLREVRAVAKLRHPNIVTAYTAFRIEGGLVFAMEHVEGLDLSRLVKAKGPLPVAHAAYFAHQAALGLQHAHERGMVHRDIKPHNLMLTHDGKARVVKILDFGLAKATREEKADTGLTSQGQALGTPDYIAPEQILDAASADIRADLYSLGATLHYLLTARPPFQATSLYDLYQAHISRDADPLNLIRPEVPAELAALVAKLMAKDPARRFQAPVEVAEALKPFFKPKAAGSLPETSLAPPAAPRGAKAVERPAPTEPMTAVPLEGKPAATLPEPRWETLVDVGEPGPILERSPDARPPGRRRAILVAAAILPLCLLAGFAGTYKWKTPEGTIVAEGVPLDADVYFDGKKVEISRPGDDKPLVIQAGPGRHTILVEKAGFKTFGESMTVAQQGTTDLRVHLEPLVAATADPAPKPDRPVPPNADPVPKPDPPASPVVDVAAEVDRRFQPGAVWVGTMTWECQPIVGEAWPQTMTIAERSGDHFKVKSTSMHLGMVVYGGRDGGELTGTIRGNWVEIKDDISPKDRRVIEGTVEGREFRYRFRRTTPEGPVPLGRGLLIYQGPLEPPPVAGAAAVEGAERLKLIGNWDHRLGDERHTMELLANGMLRRGPMRGTWTSKGDEITFRWPTKANPENAWISKVRLNPERTVYDGKGSNGEVVSGRKIGAGGGDGRPKINYGPTPVTEQASAPATQPGAGQPGTPAITAQALAEIDRRFQPGAVWVGTGTWQVAPIAGEVDSSFMTVTERSGERFKASKSSIRPGGAEYPNTTMVGTLRGNRIEAVIDLPGNDYRVFEGTIEGREFRYRFRGPGDQNSPPAGHSLLVYQGPLEPRAGAPVEGADRLKIVGRWEHLISGKRHTTDIMPNGTLRRADGRGTWTSEGDRLTFRWPYSAAPGQAWISKLRVNPEGTAYEGSGSKGEPISGRKVGAASMEDMPRVTYPPAPRAGADRPAAVAKTAVPPGGKATVLSGKWRVEGPDLIQDGDGGTILLGDQEFTSYDLKFRARIDEGDGDYSAYAHHTAPNRFMKFGIDAKAPGWHTILIKIRGTDFFTYYLDDVEVSRDADDEYKSGRVGLNARDVHARFRDIVITSPEGKVLWKGPPDLAK